MGRSVRGDGRHVRLRCAHPAGRGLAAGRDRHRTNGRTHAERRHVAVERLGRTGPDAVRLVESAAVLLGTRAIHPAERDRVIEGTLDMIANGLLLGSDTPPGG